MKLILIESIQHIIYLDDIGVGFIRLEPIPRAIKTENKAPWPIGTFMFCRFERVHDEGVENKKGPQAANKYIDRSIQDKR